MKRIISLFLFIAVFMLNSVLSQTTHTITVSGFTFSPDDLSVEIGDTVFFNGNASHPVLEVSEDTWDANGNSALSGGFAFSTGSGKVTFDEEGTHYYICENHIASGMKGKITVTASTATSINKLDIETISIYPNPLTSEYMTVEIPNHSAKIVLNIYDLTGSIKISKYLLETKGKVQINGASLSPGAYILQLQSEGFTFTSKFIKN